MRARIAAALLGLVAVVCAPGLSALAETVPRADPDAYPDAQSVDPLRVGAKVPSAEVRTIDGDPVDVATLTKQDGALLVFYRGGW